MSQLVSIKPIDQIIKRQDDRLLKRLTKFERMRQEAYRLQIMTDPAFFLV